MNRLANSPLIALTGAALVCFSPAWADAQEPPLIDLQFPGGSIAEYVKAINEAVDDFNIVVMPAARDIEMPSIQLQSVSVNAALELMQGEFHPDERTVLAIKTEEFGPWQDNEKPVFRVSAEVHRRGRPSSSDVRVWCLGDLRETDTQPEDVLSAVETAVGLTAGDYDEAQIRFHEATSLIIARGHPEQLEAIEQVVHRLRENVERQLEEEHRSAALALRDTQARREEPERSAEMMEDRIHELEELRTRFEVLLRDHEQLQQEHEALLEKAGRREAGRRLERPAER